MDLLKVKKFLLLFVLLQLIAFTIAGKLNYGKYGGYYGDDEDMEGWEGSGGYPMDYGWSHGYAPVSNPIPNQHYNLIVYPDHSGGSYGGGYADMLSKWARTTFFRVVNVFY
uniref:Putative secreted protein n=1 Tax=Lutzomyia longipalpis TaxID=7200 RepID=A0A7G3AMD0_LUTLO